MLESSITALEATAVPTAVEPMSRALSSPTTAVIPSKTFNSDAVSFIAEAWNDSKGDFRHNNSNADMLLKVFKLLQVWLQATNHMHEKNCYGASNKNLKIDNKAKINSVAFCQFDLNKALAMHEELVAEQKQKLANSK